MKVLESRSTYFASLAEDLNKSRFNGNPNFNIIIRKVGLFFKPSRLIRYILMNFATEIDGIEPEAKSKSFVVNIWTFFEVFVTCLWTYFDYVR